MEYDVFISCKSEDYKHAEEIYQFLVGNGFNTFLAPMELRKSGVSEYRKAITDAIKSSYHLILFASNPEYIDSNWVYYEWDMFVNAQLMGVKTGQIVTILNEVAVEEINSDLWKYESFTFSNYQQGLLSYVETPAYLERKREAEELTLAMEQVFTLAQEFKRKIVDIQSNDIPKITAALEKAKITHRICPVCGGEIDMSDKFCKECSWILSPFDGIMELSNIMNDSIWQISTAQSVYKTNRSLKDECTRLSETIKNLHLEMDELRRFHSNEIDVLTRELAIAKEHINGSKILHETPPAIMEESKEENPVVYTTYNNSETFNRITEKMKKIKL